MDHISATPYLDIIKALLDLGPIGLIMVLWWAGKQKTDEILRLYREDMTKLLNQYKGDMMSILNQYRDDMVEQRQMYANNASLVKRYVELAGDLKEVITYNTQTMTQLVDHVCKGDFKK